MVVESSSNMLGFFPVRCDWTLVNLPALWKQDMPRM